MQDSRLEGEHDMGSGLVPLSSVRMGDSPSSEGYRDSPEEV